MRNKTNFAASNKPKPNSNMKFRNLMLVSLLATQSLGIAAQQTAAHFDMSLTTDGMISETVTNTRYAVHSQLPPVTGRGLDGEALRFDGYSNYVEAGLPAASLSTSALTLKVVLAAESYPMMNVGEAETTPTFATICGNLDEAGKKGLALELSSQGDLRLRFASAYANGFLYTVNGNKKLPCGRWNTVSVVFDKAKNAAILYLNGESIGTGRMSRADIIHSDGDFLIGKDASEKRFGPFLINTFCGLIDDIAFYNECITPTPSEGELPRADFNYPPSRYSVDTNGQNGLWRPLFHGMPSGSWTNESHGMIYSDGRYHVFFQKNPNGPYQARLHWGHISSSDLCQWHEEPIALVPSEGYDLKGCWSGCVYEADGTPYILYTAVDNGRATIAQAKADDKELNDWTKQGIVINGRPTGLSDDFRDPYYFEAGGNRYIIVGTSKNGIGACTLHRQVNGSWTNDGTIFFQGTSASQHGTFWEMPTITALSDSKWLFTCTPMNTNMGVRTLYWIGTIDGDGKFKPDTATPQQLEMNGTSKDGYGLLSPTIYQKDNKTLLMGIVPDHLSTDMNFKMGWAHTFSLPREIQLNSTGNGLVQRPYSGLSAMRQATDAYNTNNITLNGTQELTGIKGRMLELQAEYEITSQNVNTGEMGFQIFKNGNRYAKIYYSGNTVCVDLGQMDRIVNDGNYNGKYTGTVSTRVRAGQTFKLNVFVDHSVVDVFADDTYAFSVRLFPTDADAIDVAAYSTVETSVKSLNAWRLDPNTIGNAIAQPQASNLKAQASNLYNLQGQRVDNNYKGITIVNGKKVKH